MSEEIKDWKWYDEAGEVAPEGGSDFGGVYFLLDEEEQAIKIGTALNIGQRLRDLQVGNPRQMKLIGWIPGGKEEETMLHEALCDYQLRRSEWYSHTPEILDSIRNACELHRKAMANSRECWIRLVAELAKTPLREVAKKHGSAITRKLASDRTLEEALEESLALLGKSPSG